jgi:hypothetical protein
VRFYHVKAHQVNGDEGNRRADELAVQGAYEPAVPMPALPTDDEADAAPPVVAIGFDGADEADLAELMLSPEGLRDAIHSQ